MSAAVAIAYGELRPLQLSAGTVAGSIVVVVALYSALGSARAWRRNRSFRPRPVYAVLGLASTAVVAALGVAT